jgi:hypothetical protein
MDIFHLEMSEKLEKITNYRGGAVCVWSYFAVTFLSHMTY